MPRLVKTPDWSWVCMWIAYMSNTLLNPILIWSNYPTSPPWTWENVKIGCTGCLPFILCSDHKQGLTDLGHSKGQAPKWQCFCGETSNLTLLMWGTTDRKEYKLLLSFFLRLRSDTRFLDIKAPADICSHPPSTSSCSSSWSIVHSHTSSCPVSCVLSITKWLPGYCLTSWGSQFSASCVAPMMSRSGDPCRLDWHWHDVMIPAAVVGRWWLQHGHCISTWPSRVLQLAFLIGILSWTACTTLFSLSWAWNSPFSICS
jgi:hypothetical protein